MGDRTQLDRIGDMEDRVNQQGNEIAALRLMLSNLEKRLFVIPKGDTPDIDPGFVRHKPFTVRGQ